MRLGVWVVPCSGKLMALGIALAGFALLVGAGERKARLHSAEKDAVNAAALQRTRDQVRMLDDLYKTAVVHITDTYVVAQERKPAATLAKKIFAAMKDKGYHSARLVDATGEPLNRDNAPQTDFEKKAVAMLKEGKATYEEIGVQDGKPVLRAATVVPVVMDKCIACHPGYKKGDLLGALIYEVPIK
ncbi:MAG: DUF3365 domain-containing protein [Gemmataceae bacterium]